MILTVGHSTRSAEEFLQLLKAHAVTHLVDIRTVPRSRHNPQYNLDTLPATLAANGIAFTHMPGLGGLRSAKKDSINSAWRNASFRGYADYMQTPEFKAALQQLIDLSETAIVAIMCAEAVPWRCHRSLVADALAARDIPVEHIMTPTRRDPHRLTAFAKVKGHQVTYPAGSDQLELL